MVTGVSEPAGVRAVNPMSFDDGASARVARYQVPVMRNAASPFPNDATAASRETPLAPGVMSPEFCHPCTTPAALTSSAPVHEPLEPLTRSFTFCAPATVDIANEWRWMPALFSTSL